MPKPATMKRGCSPEKGDLTNAQAIARFTELLVEYEERNPSQEQIFDAFINVQYSIKSVFWIRLGGPESLSLEQIKSLLDYFQARHRTEYVELSYEELKRRDLELSAWLDLLESDAGLSLLQEEYRSDLRDYLEGNYDLSFRVVTEIIPTKHVGFQAFLWKWALDLSHGSPSIEDLRFLRETLHRPWEAGLEDRVKDLIINHPDATADDILDAAYQHRGGSWRSRLRELETPSVGTILANKHTLQGLRSGSLVERYWRAVFEADVEFSELCSVYSLLPGVDEKEQAFFDLLETARGDREKLERLKETVDEPIEIHGVLSDLLGLGLSSDEEYKLRLEARDLGLPYSIYRLDELERPLEEIVQEMCDLVSS